MASKLLSEKCKLTKGEGCITPNVYSCKKNNGVSGFEKTGLVIGRDQEGDAGIRKHARYVLISDHTKNIILNSALCFYSFTCRLFLQ